MPLPRLEDYLDFRNYLRDWYQSRKIDEPWLTHRLLAQKYGLGSPSHFGEILRGRKLSEDYLERYCAMLDLDKQRVKIFRALVDYAQCGDPRREAEAFAKLKKLGCGPAQEALDDIARDFFADPLRAILFNLTACHPALKDAKALAKHLRYPASLARIEGALDFLTKAGFLHWNEGAWTHDSQHLRFGAKRKSPILADYHEAMLELGQRAWREHREAQHLSTVTLSVSESTHQAIRQRLRAFRQELVQLAAEDPQAERVLHINLHLLELDIG